MKNNIKIYLSLVFIIISQLSCVQGKQNTHESHSEIGFLLKGNWIFIKLKVNNSDSLNFIFDSGVDETIINQKTADNLNLKFNKKANFSGALGSDSVFFSENNMVQIGNIKLDSVILVRVPLDNYEQTFGVRVDGFIGESLLKRYIVNIDFENERMQFFSNSRDFPQSDSLFSMDMEIENKVPLIQTSFIIKGIDTLSGKFMIDLGFKNAVAFNTPFINKNNLIAGLDQYYCFNATGIISEKKSYLARMKVFKFGGYCLDSITYILSQSSSGTISTGDYDGIIGMDVFMRFASIGFDYKDKKFYIGKYRYIKDNIFSDVNCSGIELKKSMNSSKIIINDVYENSPASEAGVRSGDELFSIKGTEVSKLDLTDIKKMLREKGKTIDIQIKRTEKIFNFRLHLRELI